MIRHEVEMPPRSLLAHLRRMGVGTMLLLGVFAAGVALFCVIVFIVAVLSLS